jgi:N-acetylneuraminic acid mutarotase
VKKTTFALTGFLAILTTTIQAQLNFDNTGNVGIGTSTPNNKLELKANSADASGLRFTNLTSNSLTQPISSKVLSVDIQGNVILVPASVSTGGGVPTSGIILSETEPNTNLTNNGFSIYGAMNFSFNAYNAASPVYRYLSNTITTNILPTLQGGLHSAIWTGSKMIVYGGFTPNYSSSPYGASYDPSTNAWANITPVPVNAGQRMSHSAVWTGTKMIVFGGRYGFNGFSQNLGTLTNYGALYDPTTDSWTAISNTNAPTPRDRHASVWTGDKMIVWGGAIATGGAGSTNTGGIYDPATDTWTAISTTNAPSSRGCFTGIWTGSKFIVWGGCTDPNSNNGNPLNTGGIYDPATDIWTTITTTNAPTARSNHITVWTGSKMIVFGGVVASGASSTGGIYDPTTDTWANVNVTNAPTSSVNGVWTGTKMLVWGDSVDGGLYDPNTYSWTKVEGNGTIPSVGSKAVWTGTQMITTRGGVGGEIIGLSPFQSPTTKKLFLYKKD